MTNMELFANLLVLLDGFVLNLVNPRGGIIPLNLFNSYEVISPSAAHDSHSQEEHKRSPLQPPHFGTDISLPLLKHSFYILVERPCCWPMAGGCGDAGERERQ